MNRIMVIGSGGAGKSTLSRQLGEILSIDVIHLDQFYWKSGWVGTEMAEFREETEKIIRNTSWVIDGNYSPTLSSRLTYADTVIYLDFPR